MLRATLMADRRESMRRRKFLKGRNTREKVDVLGAAKYGVDERDLPWRQAAVTSGFKAVEGPYNLSKV